jgi:DNA-binding MarR family transcriptional regulator
MVAVASIFNPSDQENLDRKIAVGFERIAQALKTLVWEESKTSGLSPIQIQFLTALLHDVEHEVTIGFLASQFSLTPATVSDAITALEQKEMVVRERRVEDKRTVFLSLTPKGKSAARKLSTWANLLEARVSELSDEQKVAVLHSLMSIIKGFQDDGVVSLTRMCVACKFFRPNAHKNTLQPHHCAYIDRSFGDAELRIDCPEFDAVEVS